MAPFWRIQKIAALVSKPPEKAIPTRSPTGSDSRICPVFSLLIASSLSLHAISSIQANTSPQAHTMLCEPFVQWKRKVARFIAKCPCRDDLLDGLPLHVPHPRPLSIAMERGA